MSRRPCFPDPRNKMSNDYIQQIRDKRMDDLAACKELKSKRPAESIDEFVARGGRIRKYAYKWPPGWKMTFNGFSKYDRKPRK